MIGPEFEALANSGNSLKFYKLDVDDNAEAAEKAGIEAMPTFKVYSRRLNANPNANPN